ncbi:MAG TPA: acyl-CoA thioesterase [Polyangiaceae bacterium]|nr:acyl-CoA thioesterase [Polyangiaceae bacterium]
MPASETPAKLASESRLVLHTLMLPEHANALGNVHGGVILRFVDEAGAIAAMRHARKPCVTIAIDSMTFRHPVHLGELLVCSAEVTWVGKSSIEVHVDVHAEHPITGTTSHTNSGYVVYVALGEDGRPSPVTPLALTTDAARATFEAGARRQAHRVANR